MEQEARRKEIKMQAEKMQAKLVSTLDQGLLTMRTEEGPKETEAKRRGETPFGGHGGWALSASHHTPGCA